jgi:hypothetical protein
MKNNNGKGLYEIGERINLPCGCVVIAEAIGYTHIVHPECKFDNVIHPSIPGYAYHLPTLAEIHKYNLNSNKVAA